MPEQPTYDRANNGNLREREEKQNLQRIPLNSHSVLCRIYFIRYFIFQNIRIDIDKHYTLSELLTVVEYTALCSPAGVSAIFLISGQTADWSLKLVTISTSFSLFHLLPVFLSFLFFFLCRSRFHVIVWTLTVYHNQYVPSYMSCNIIS